MIKKIVFMSMVGLLVSNYAFAGDCNISHENVRFYEQLSKKNPSSVCSRYNLANEYVLKNKIQKALNTYDEIIEINPKEENAYKERARLYRIYNNPTEADREYGRLIKNVPNSISGNYNMAIIYENLSDYETALKYINKAIELSNEKGDNNIWYIETRAEILEKMERYEEAIEDYKKYAESDDSYNYGAYFGIQRCYEALGNKEKAKEAVRKWQSGFYNREKYKSGLIRNIKRKYSRFKEKLYAGELF